MRFAQVNRNANKPESYGVQNTAFVDLGIDLFHAITQQGLNQRFPKAVLSMRTPAPLRAPLLRFHSPVTLYSVR